MKSKSMEKSDTQSKIIIYYNFRMFQFIFQTGMTVQNYTVCPIIANFWLALRDFILLCEGLYLDLAIGCPRKKKTMFVL